MADTAGLEKDRVSWPAGIVVFEEAQLHGVANQKGEGSRDRTTYTRRLGTRTRRISFGIGVQPTASLHQWVSLVTRILLS